MPPQRPTRMQSPLTPARPRRRQPARHRRRSPARSFTNLLDAGLDRGRPGGVLLHRGRGVVGITDPPQLRAVALNQLIKITLIHLGHMVVLDQRQLVISAQKPRLAGVGTVVAETVDAQPRMLQRAGQPARADHHIGAGFQGLLERVDVAADPPTLHPMIPMPNQQLPQHRAISALPRTLRHYAPVPGRHRRFAEARALVLVVPRPPNTPGDSSSTLSLILASS